MAGDGQTGLPPFQLEVARMFFALPAARKRRVNADGVEMHVAVDYLTGFGLTRSLLDQLRAGAPPSGRTRLVHRHGPRP